MVDINVLVSYEIWLNRKIISLSKYDIISIETDTDSIKDLISQIRYYFKDEVKENTYNWNCEIVEIVKGKLDNFTLLDLNKIKITLK